MDPLHIALKVSLVGVVVVFSALLLIGVVISLLTLFESREEVSPVATPEAEVPEEIVAVISAAIHVAMGAGVRVKRVRYGRKARENSWSKQGRVTIMASHLTKD